MARPRRRSTSTALAFMLTSMQPISAPMMIKASASSNKVGARTTAASVTLASTANTCTTRTEP